MTKPPPRRGRGQPQYEPTPSQRQTVAVMAANGATMETIAKSLGGIALKTLRRHFKAELEDGHAQVVAAIAGSLVRSALNGNVHAARFWLACRGGPEWRERREVGGIPDGVPISISTESRVVVYIPDNNRDDRKPDQ